MVRVDVCVVHVGALGEDAYYGRNTIRLIVMHHECCTIPPESPLCHGHPRRLLS
ncbi:hypothetical protein RSOL_412830 [Rhizoctonia solani AG-3 Rhs1AP]|uniref:Uncharacterized protein n=1 Tax=Rhizoctonia solani AG-3 Rhs1AP TaxID=1086054 RepID=X8JE89_9AGAM|nr:hypothetical protein RSOL_412830 [Rhizoctonia solani AG-3 Rhs1AP]